MPAAGERGEIDAVQAPIESQRNAGMRQAFGMQPCGSAGLFQQFDRALFEHPCPHAAKHMLAARAFENDRLDADAGQKLAKQQAGRP